MNMVFGISIYVSVTFHNNLSRGH